MKAAASRLLGSLGALLGAVMIAFVCLRLLPADPAQLILGPFASPDELAAQRDELGLDDPLPQQFVTFVGDFARGDWGYSFSNGAEVTTVIGQRLPATIELALYAFIVAFVAAVLLALWAAYRPGSRVDGAVRAISTIGLGTPPFWIALVLLLIFTNWLPILPGPSGRLDPGVAAPPDITGLYTVDAVLARQPETLLDALQHLLLPVLALSLLPFAFLVRLLRANLLDVAGQPYLTVARGKGLSGWTVWWRHALPNAFLPTLTSAGLVFAELLGGSLLVEKVFNWPGLGQLVVDGVLRQDYAVAETFVVLSAVAYIVVNLVVDLLYGVIDPRVRVRGQT